MSSRINLTLQILEQLGAPLTKAVIEKATESGKSGAEDKEAQAVAALLANSVKVGLALSDALNLSDNPGSDAVRLALTGLSSRLVSVHYAETGKPPSDNELKRMVTALEAVLSFADNFSPEPDTILRLQAMDPETFLADEKQVHIQYINTLVPVIDAVSDYSFGRPENKFVQDVTQTLLRESKKLRQDLIPGLEDDIVGRRIELQILKALTALYISCHEEEKQRLSQMDDKERAEAQSGGSLSLESLWENFQRRLAMMTLLGQTILPDPVQAGDGQMPSHKKPEKTESHAKPAAVKTADSEPSAAPEPQPAEENQTPAQQPDREQEDDQSYNPMSFFTSGNEETDEA